MRYVQLPLDRTAIASIDYNIRVPQRPLPDATGTARASPVNSHSPSALSPITPLMPDWPTAWAPPDSKRAGQHMQKRERSI